MSRPSLAVHREVHRLLVALTLAGILFLAARNAIGSDTWWHLRTGAWIWEHRRLPQVDEFSYTRYAVAWRPPGWPVQVTFYLLHRYVGLGALNVWTAVLAVAAYLLIAGTVRGGPYLRALALLLAALTGNVYQAARPYMLTTLLTALFLWALETWWQHRGSGRRLWLLPPAMTLWVNAHAGFLAGFLVWLAYLGEALVNPKAYARRVPLLSLGLGLLAATLVNPLGPRVWLYPLGTLRLQRLTWIQEWQAPDFTQPQTWPFLLWWFLALGVQTTGAPRWRWRHLVLWMLFAALSFRAVRNLALFSLVAPLVWTAYARPWWSHFRKVLARLLPAFPPRQPPRPRPALNRALTLIAWTLAGLKLLAISTPQAVQQAVAQNFPQSAVTYLQATRPLGRLFNSYNWGGYLIWALPEYPVFIDGRTDLYGDEFLELWVRIVRAEPGWAQVLDRYRVNVVLLEPTWPLVRVLPLVGWREVYRDGQSVVFLRYPPVPLQP